MATQPPKSPFIVGLTGGLASGKSTLAAIFATLGAGVIDADDVSREVVAIGQPALADIARAFGADMLLADGTLDRRRLREHIFTHPDAKKQLEAITHPRIFQALQAHITRLAAQHPYVVLVNAILIETGWHKLVNRVLVIDVPEGVQTQRACARDGMNEALAQQMLANQLSREARLAAANDVIVNTGDIQALQYAANALHQQYLSL